MLNPTKALLYYRPPTAILVDGNEDFFNKTRLFLQQEEVAYRLFTRPEKVYTYFEKYYEPNHLVNQCISQKEDQDLNHRIVDIDIRPIHHAIYNRKRFENATVVIINHAPPHVDGIKLCRQLKNYPIKKILLIEPSTHHQAIEALNEGIIDAVINKNADDMPVMLHDVIVDLHKRQLHKEQSFIINSLIFRHPGEEASCLGDSAFLAMFDKLVSDHHICEYYLSDENGSYVMFNNKGHPSWLVIKGEDEMAADCIEAEDSGPTVSLDVIQGLKNCSLIFDSYGDDFAPAEWKAKGLLHPATPLTGKEETYYYAYIENPKAHSFHDKILSFSEYQKINHF